MFITVFTTALHLFKSWDHALPSYSFKIHFNITLNLWIGLRSCLFSVNPQSPVRIFLFLHACYDLSHLFLLPKQSAEHYDELPKPQPTDWHLSRYNCSVAVRCTAGHLPKALSALQTASIAAEPSHLPVRSVAIALFVVLRQNEILLSGNGCCQSAVQHGTLAVLFVKNTNTETYRFCNPPLFPATFTCRELHENPQDTRRVYPINNCTRARQGAESRAVNCLWCGQLQGQVRHLL